MDEGEDMAHTKSTLISMQVTINENMLTQGLLYLNQILIEILFCGRGFSQKRGA